MNVGSGALSVSANISNVQNGSVSDVQFSVNDSSKLSVSPTSDSSSPYSTVINPINPGTVTVTASGRMNGATRCSDTATVNITDDAAPECFNFTANPTSVVQSGTMTLSANITDSGSNILPNGSFESGTTAGWPTIAGTLTPIDGIVNPPVVDGYYYGRIGRADNPDPHVATGFINTGENLNGQQYTFSFWAKAHEANKTIERIMLQRDNWLGSWQAPAQTFIPGVWQKYSFNITLPVISGSGSTSIRAVLRPPLYDNWPVYYDDVKLFKTNTSGVNSSSVRFYYASATADLCNSGSWTEIPNTTNNGSGNYSVNWNTTGVSEGDYVVAANASDINGNAMTGNPGGCTTSNLTVSPACNATVEVTQCSPMCGQLPGCATDDLGNPPAVSNIQPTPERNMSTNPGNIPITWTDTSTGLTDSWTVVVYAGAQRTTAQLNTIATNCASYATGSGGVQCVTRPYSATPSWTYAPGTLRRNDLYIAIRATNSTCAPYNANVPQYSGWTQVPLNLVANITGNLYDGDGTPTASICTGPTNPAAFAATTDRTVSAAAGGIPHTARTSPFSILNVPYVPNSNWGSGTAVSLSLVNNDLAQAWACECPPSASPGDPFNCSYSSIYSPATGVNFWLQNYNLLNDPWWQAWGGMIYAASGDVVSNITQECIDDVACRPFIAAQDLDSTDYSGGIVTTGSGSASSGSIGGYITDRTPGSEQHVAEGTFHENVRQENYDFFIREVLISDYSNPVPATVDDSSDIFNSDFSEDSDDQTRIYYAASSVTIDPTSTIELPAGVTKAVVLINGNLTIRDSSDIEEVVNVDEGDFLGFIVNGSITVEASVGFDTTLTSSEPVSDDTNLEGVYVADTSLIVDGYDQLGFANISDRKFIGAGTFVGFQGVTMNRNFANDADPLANAMNNLNPVVTFVYRPDLVRNLPKFMHNPGMVWQEVN